MNYYGFPKFIHKICKNKRKGKQIFHRGPWTFHESRHSPMSLGFACGTLSCFLFEPEVLSSSRLTSREPADVRARAQGPMVTGYGCGRPARSLPRPTVATPSSWPAEAAAAGAEAWAGGGLAMAVFAEAPSEGDWMREWRRVWRALWCSPLRAERSRRQEQGRWAGGVHAWSPRTNDVSNRWGIPPNTCRATMWSAWEAIWARSGPNLDMDQKRILLYSWHSPTLNKVPWSLEF
jgi:hypothetical protein